MFPLMWANRDHGASVSPHRGQTRRITSTEAAPFEYSFCVCRLKLKNYLENRKEVSLPLFRPCSYLAAHGAERKFSPELWGCSGLAVKLKGFVRINCFEINFLFGDKNGKTGQSVGAASILIRPGVSWPVEQPWHRRKSTAPLTKSTASLLKSKKHTFIHAVKRKKESQTENVKFKDNVRGNTLHLRLSS